MRFAECLENAVLWTCWLENYVQQARILANRGLGPAERLMFDDLGRFFPCDQYYSRCVPSADSRCVTDLRDSPKECILPWIYRPTSCADRIQGKRVIAPSHDMFAWLDDKVAAKELFAFLGMPTPRWDFTPLPYPMLEKPRCDSSGGLGIRVSDQPPQTGCFLEEYLPSHRSIGIQYFASDVPEFVCSNEMILPDDPMRAFTFCAQENVPYEDLPSRLHRDCETLVQYLITKGYRGFIGIDVLIRDSQYSFLEINPRGIAFLPAYFAATARRWRRFRTYTDALPSASDALILLDFGTRKKVVERLP